MLVIKAYVNYDYIDEIHIQRMESFNEKGIYEYKIRKPKGYEHKQIFHKYYDGWEVLTEKALGVINNKLNYNDKLERDY